ncbi:MAG TPA: methylenetetrahydrofolate reductase [Burkholderiales bacterium]|nr:methylenetetrahydrofolate reductase [Burkholderiales bacterium]
MAIASGSLNPTASDELAQCVADLVTCGSLEICTQGVRDAREVASLLPVGSRVYVNHLPRRTLMDSLPTLKAAHESGLEPVPHLSARRIGSRDELRSFLVRAVNDAGVRRVLLIGGDEPKPLGPYPDSVALLRDGMLALAGIREIGIAGYPEGHPFVPRAALERAMADKLALAAEQGLSTHIVTQFSFAPARVIEFCADLSRRAPGVPVYVGMAGPTQPSTLIKFAQRCGVSASLRALSAEGMKLVRLVTHTAPDDQLVALARYCLAHADCNVVGTHFYTFGGVIQTAEWMRRVIEAPATAG